MSTLYMVRHGQARFMTDDYDRLSDLGRAQGRLVGEFFAREGICVDRVWTGTLVRQRDTATEAASAAAEAAAPWPEAQVLEGLDEYPAEDIQRVIAPRLSAADPQFAEELAALKAAADRKAKYKAMHRVLEAVMEAWIDGRYDGEGLISWKDFSGGVSAAIQTIMSEAPRGSTTVVVTSGGPIGVATQTVLRAPQLEAARLNWRVYNASITRFTFSGRRVSLDQFNAIPHLTTPEVRSYR